MMECTHADKMRRYAEDAKMDKQPWKMWEYREPVETWQDLDTHPHWDPKTDYRRKTDVLVERITKGNNCALRIIDWEPPV